MRARFTYACMLLAALLALAAAPWLAWQEAERQAYAAQSDLGLRYAHDMLYRVDETVRQALGGLALLSRYGADPCSAEAQATMRRVALGASYLKAVGHVRDGVMQCSSLGGAPFPLGSRVLRQSTGELIYARVPVDGSRPSSLMAIQRGGFGALFDSNLPLDTGTASPGMSLAVLHLERRADEPVSMASGFVDRAWVARLDGQAQVSFTDGNYLVSIARSTLTPSAGVAALPLSAVAAQRNALAWRLVPAGLVAGIAMAAALLLLARQQNSLESALRKALRNDELFLLYQPVVDLGSGRCIGVEALLRWRRSSGELIGPDLFIPLAEQTGMITRVTARVLQLVERDTSAFLHTHPDFHVAINLAASDLHSNAIVAALEPMLAASGPGTANVVVEITERGILDIEAARPVIGALRGRGVHVAIDDFGTGYAGLSYLESLQVDFLKIDRSFIETIGTGAPTNQVVGHIIAMASAMGLRMVAEGIETPAQADYLRERGVQFAQGWLFGKPRRFEEVVADMEA